MDFDIPAKNRLKVKKKQKAGKIPELYQRAEKALEHESDSNTNHNQGPWNGL